MKTNNKVTNQSTIDNKETTGTTEKEKKLLETLLMNFTSLKEGDDTTLDGVNHDMAEMFNITFREPDPDFYFSEKKKKEVINIMMNSVQNAGNEEISTIGKTLFPEIVKNIELIMAKLHNGEGS